MSLKNHHANPADEAVPDEPQQQPARLSGQDHHPSTSRQTAAVEEKQRLVLHELAITLQTLECLTQVLDDLVVLTDAEAAPSTTATSSVTVDGSTIATAALTTTTPAMAWSSDQPPSSFVSIAMKQERLLEELHKWKDLL